MLLRNNGAIQFEITGRKRYSRGIPPGGLEIPCHLLFEGNKKYVNMTSKKLKKLRIIKDKQTTSNDQEKVKAEPEAMNKVVDLSLTQEAKRSKLFHSEEIGSDDSGKDEIPVDGEWVYRFSTQP